MQKQSILLFIILGILLLIMSVTIGYFIGSGTKKQIKYPLPTTIIEIKPTPNQSFQEILISKLEQEPVQNPPSSVTKCLYENKIVYYVPPKCCDQFSVLYNENGDSICAPDGGITGNGDGQCVDFFDQRKNCELVWQDSRKYGKSK